MLNVSAVLAELTAHAAVVQQAIDALTQLLDTPSPDVAAVRARKEPQPKAPARPTRLGLQPSSPGVTEQLKAVEDAVRRGLTSPAAIRVVTGLDVLTCKTRLERLLKLGRITRTGRARGVVYLPAASSSGAR
jgi:hypothetical protein